MKYNSKISNHTHTFCYVLLLLVMLTHSVQASLSVRITEQKQLKDKNLTTEEITEKLQLAAQYKRSDPKLLKQLIFELKKQENITDVQQHELDLLFTAYLFYIGKFEKAMPILKALLKQKASDSVKFRANYSLLVIATTQKNWLEGLKYAAINIKSLPTIKNSEYYQNGLVANIVFYNQIGQYQLAQKYIERFSKQKLSSKYDCWLRQLSIEARFNLKELNFIDDSLDETIKKCISANFIIASHIVRIHKAKLYLQNKMPKKALGTLINNIEDINATNYPMLISEMNNTIAKVYWELHNIENAKKYATKASQINKDTTNLLQGVETYLLLYKIAKKQNNVREALSYYEKYAALDKNNLDEIKTKHIAFQLAEHQAFEKESQIQLLNEKNALLVSEKALDKAKVANIQLMITILTIVLALLTLWGGRLLKVHKHVKELAEYDALTGIYNRRHFTHITNIALKHCKNAKQELSIIIFDLDHFKKVNDSFGHACGDWALKETIKACQNIGRKNDIFARLGGEEFCIVLPSCNIETAMMRAENCRAAIEAIMTEASGFKFILTASFGVTNSKLSGFDLDNLLADADFSAYASKDSGRNRVTMFEVPQEKKLDNSWDYN